MSESGASEPLVSPDTFGPSTWTRLLHQSIRNRAAIQAHVDHDDTVLMVSDYSSGPPNSRYTTYSFLAISPGSMRDWWAKCSIVRRIMAVGDRTFSYKTLGDWRKQDSLASFLDACNHLKGIVVTFAVAKQVQSIFSINPRESFREVPDDLRMWKQEVFERLLRIASIGASVLGVLCKPLQDVLWVTDDDEVIDSQAKLLKATELIPRIAAPELPGCLGHMKFGPLRYQSSPERDILRDLMAVPDFLAGAFCDLLNRDDDDLLRVAPPGLLMPSPEDLPIKTRYLIGWAAQAGKNLSRNLILLDPGRPSGVRVRMIQTVLSETAARPQVVGSE